MNRTKIILVAIPLIVLGLGWAGYRKTATLDRPAPELKKRYEGKIIIGAAPWPGYLALYVARDKGYFKETHLDVEIKNYDGLSELSKDYQSGKIQGRANLTLDAIQESLAGLDHRVVLAIDHSTGADAIIARKGIQDVRDFKGMRVAYERGTLEEFFLTWALLQNGLSLSDVQPVFANPEESAKLLQKGRVDVAVSYEPFVSPVIRAGKAHVVYSSKDAPGLITDILTFRTEFITAYPDTIEDILRAYFKAIAYWKEHPQDVCAILAREFRDTPGNIAEQLKLITVMDEGDNRTAFTYAAGLESLYGNMRKTGEFVLQKNRKGVVHLDTDRLLEKKFIKKIMKG